MSGTREEHHRLFHNRSRDASEHAATIVGWQLEYLQLSAGDFDGKLSQLVLNNVTIIHEQTNQVLMKRGTASAGSIVVSLPIASSGSAHFRGRALPAASILASSGADLPELLSPSKMDLVCVTINREWLLIRALELGYFQLSQHELQSDIFLVPETHRRGLAMFIKALFRESSEHPEILAHSQSRSNMENALAERLLVALSHAEGAETSQDTDRKKTAEKAIELAFDDVSKALDIASICRTLGVSRRYLQNCFLSSYGSSATHVLRAIRLNRVRNELKENALSARPQSIGDIAARWGFWHWSRFTAEYRDHFGELPSAILRSRRA